MFGFGSKKKKTMDQFVTFITSVMGTYRIMRALSTHRFEETNLGEVEIQIFEACYILGVIDCIAAAVDSEGKIIDQDHIIAACRDCSIGMGIFDEEFAERNFHGAILLIREGNAAHKLQYFGGKDTQACINAMLDGKDSSEASKAMSLNYLDDKDLINDFKELFDLNMKE